MEDLLPCLEAIHLMVLLTTNVRIIAQETPPTETSRGRLASKKAADAKTRNNFSIYWNVPSQRCAFKYGINIDVSNYGFISNSHDGWAGEQITILPQPGHYPHVENGSSVYGGIPQNANLRQHVAELLRYVSARIPNKTFHGLAIVDYEAWQPLWSLNFDTRRVYQELSIDDVMIRHPDWSSKKVVKEARKEFENSARMFLKATMTTVQSTRPGGRWGLYHYPYCFNEDKCAVSKTSCPAFALQANNELLWLFQSETALYPSAYLHNAANSSCNRIFVDARLNEAKRIWKMLSRKGDSIPAYLYCTFLYKENRKFYKLVDLENSIARAFDVGLSGVVLWADHKLSKDELACHQLKYYIDEVLGPFVFKLLHRKRLPVQ